MKAAILAALGTVAALAMASPGKANDFSLGYDVDRFPAAKLSMQACRAAVTRGAAAVGYSTRVDQDQKTLVLHVSAPREDGRSLISYCISAGDHTVFVIQAFDYSGPNNPDVDRVKARVGAEVRKAARDG
ncbi:hypothetical protein IFT63_07170 [Stenotrophomonas sp. CFBP 13724]|uniref:DUF6180 family protein n=1 Tax=Stenotrophomonas sp. CFBP 13724 TaxID=2775298 RepID=UPI0017822303|nr:DUF6180 family protein [Stenotrophomonas sp. CFBP 13724]MBD8643370.1 hypothetical protein [Stenotrophomonas sp. CFBP 13724]